MDAPDNDETFYEKRARETSMALHEISKHLQMMSLHTSYLFWLAVFVVFLSLVQGLAVWNGDPWRPHSEHFSVQALRWSRELHKWAGEEHPTPEGKTLLEKHYGNHVEEDHEEHPSKIEMVVRNHWQSNVVWLIFHLNFVLFASWLFKWLSSYAVLGYNLTLFAMLMCVVSGVVLFVSVISWIYLFVWFFTLTTILGTMVTLLAFLIEIATLQNLHEIRNYNFFVSAVARDLHNQESIQISIGASRRIPKEDQKLMREIACHPTQLYHIIMQFICLFPHQLEQQLRSSTHRKTD